MCYNINWSFYDWKIFLQFIDVLKHFLNSYSISFSKIVTILTYKQYLFIILVLRKQNISFSFDWMNKNFLRSKFSGNFIVWRENKKCLSHHKPLIDNVFRIKQLPFILTHFDLIKCKFQIQLKKLNHFKKMNST
jgi:hypothetical protein